MSNRLITFLLKKSGVPNKIPTELALGELAINYADVKLYASGTTANSILQIGWDRVSRTGDTMTRQLIVPSISATTYYGLPQDIYLTGGTLNSGTITFNNNVGGSFQVTGFTGTEPITFNGTSSLNFGFTSGLEGDYTSTVVTNTNILSTSQVLINVIPSTDHNESEDSILDGLSFKVSDIVDGVGFNINCYANNNTWGIYNISYKIIN